VKELEVYQDKVILCVECREISWMPLRKLATKVKTSKYLFGYQSETLSLHSHTGETCSSFLSVMAWVCVFLTA